jgi:hypothetical protein
MLISSNLDKSRRRGSGFGSPAVTRGEPVEEVAVAGDEGGFVFGSLGGDVGEAGGVQDG